MEQFPNVVQASIWKASTDIKHTAGIKGKHGQKVQHSPFVLLCICRL